MDVQIKRNAWLRVAGEPLNLGDVGARADQMRDRRMPEIVEGELLRAVRVQPAPISCWWR
jgi:hypothetical protein